MFVPRVYLLVALATTLAVSSYAQDQQMLELLVSGDPVAEVAPGDLIAVNHCSSLLEKAGIEVAIRDSPYRFMLESSGPSTILVRRADLIRSRKILSDYAAQGFITLDAKKVQPLTPSYKFIGLSELTTSDLKPDRDKVLTRCLASFVEDVMPRRHMTVMNLGIRQRKYLAAAADSHLSVGYDVIVVTKQPGSDTRSTYHIQFLATNLLTNWELLPAETNVR